MKISFPIFLAQALRVRQRAQNLGNIHEFVHIYLA
jgi:hypothetical protein